MERSHAPLDFYDGITCSFNLEVTNPLAPCAFDVVMGSRIGIVYIYNSMMDFIFNSRVEESSTKCRQPDSAILLLLEAITMIVFFLVVIERLLKILF